MRTQPSNIVRIILRHIPEALDAENPAVEAQIIANIELYFRVFRDKLLDMLRCLELQTRAEHIGAYLRALKAQSACDIDYAKEKVLYYRVFVHEGDPILGMMERATQILANKYSNLVHKELCHIWKETLTLVFFRLIMEEMQMFSTAPPPVTHSASWHVLEERVQAISDALAALNGGDPRDLERKLKEASSAKKLYQKCWETCRICCRFGSDQPSNFVYTDLKRYVERDCNGTSDLLNRLDSRGFSISAWLCRNRRAESFWFQDTQGGHDSPAVQDHRRLSETLEYWKRELEAFVQRLRVDYAQLQDATAVPNGEDASNKGN